MEQDRDQLLQEAERARRWAEWLADDRDRERLKAVARDYDELAQSAQHEAVNRKD